MTRSSSLCCKSIQSVEISFLPFVSSSTSRSIRIALRAVAASSPPRPSSLPRSPPELLLPAADLFPPLAASQPVTRPRSVEHHLGPSVLVTTSARHPPSAAPVFPRPAPVRPERSSTGASLFIEYDLLYS